MILSTSVLQAMLDSVDNKHCDSLFFFRTLNFLEEYKIISSRSTVRFWH